MIISDSGIAHGAGSGWNKIQFLFSGLIVKRIACNTHGRAQLSYSLGTVIAILDINDFLSFAMQKNDVIEGKYRLLEPIGAGSTGTVWRAAEMINGEAINAVAIKIFDSDININELRTLAGLRHGNILEYRAYVRHEGRYGIVTEFADGGDAATLIELYPDGMPGEFVELVALGTGKALRYLHQNDIVHRDIKPANILIVGDRAKLGDVGVAKKLTGGLMRHTMSSHTLLYAAPEMFRGQVGFKSDMYSLGISVYEMIMGRMPFGEDVPAGTTEDRIRLFDTIAPRYRTMIEKLTERDPDARWSADDLVDYLDTEGEVRMVYRPERRHTEKRQPVSVTYYDADSYTKTIVSRKQLRRVYGEP